MKCTISNWIEIEDCTVELKYLIGSKWKVKDKIATCENCLINRLVLGIEPEVPLKLDALRHCEQLEKYQKEDVIKALSIRNNLNANRMGYGKTVEAIIAMRNMDLVPKVLIIVPKPIIEQWKYQLKIWWPAMANQIHTVDDSLVSLDASGIYLINYEKVPLTRFYYKLKAIRWDLIICDEVHKIKSYKGKRANMVRSLPANKRWGLTGTPILNRPDDLYGVWKFIDPDIVGRSYWNFRAYFCKLAQGPFGIVNAGLTDDVFKLEILKKIKDRICITNPDLKLTPGKTVEIVPVKMSKEQLALYCKVKQIILDELPEKLTIPNGAVRCLRLQQITSSPMIWDEAMVGSKFEWIAETIGNNPDEKFVVFSQFAEACKCLQKYLKAKNINTVTYIGANGTEGNAENKFNFIHDQSVKVLAGTIKAMGEGVDQLQDASNKIIFLDRDWSPEILQQCEDRLNRYGQKKKVQIWYLECTGTFDRHVGRVILKKAEDIKMILSVEDE